MASKIFNSAVFKGPKFSFFDMSHPNLVSMKFGEIPVIYWDYLNPGDKAVFDMSQVVRLSPMLQPILSQIDITVDAYAVRLRTLGMAERNPWKYEDFFNANKNLSGDYSLPSAKASDIGLAAKFKKGTLYDFLGYPTLEGFKEKFRENVLAKYPYLQSSELGWRIDMVEETPVVYVAPLAFPGTISIHDLSLGWPSSRQDDVIESNAFAIPSVSDSGSPLAVSNLNGIKVTPSSPGVSNVNLYPVLPLSVFAILACVHGLDLEDELIGSSPFDYFSSQFAFFAPQPAAGDTYLSIIETYSASGLSLPEFIFRNYKYDWQEIESAWFDYIFYNYYIVGTVHIPSGMLTQYDSFLNHFVNPLFVDSVSSVSSSWFKDYPGDSSLPYPDSIVGLTPSVNNSPDTSNVLVPLYSPLYPALSYWKIISDWYLNTGLFNPEDWYLDKIFTDENRDTYNLPAIFGDCYHRNWNNDYFTSAFTEAQRGLAVGVPADGTIPDLRNANALQKFKERLLFAGHKFRDVVYSIFGIKMSNVVADQSEPLGRWVNPVNIDSVLQTSQSSSESALASYAGTGLSYGNKRNILHYIAEEPTVIMFLASIRPKHALYFQGLPRKLTRNFLMDYAIPQFVNVGEQMISERELYLDYKPYQGTDPSSLYSNIFGFTRRFADFMFAPGEVHGDFKDSLSSWHLARKFDSAPSLNQEFLEVRGVEDNLNRIFASVSDATDKFYCNFYFSGGIVRSLPKRIYYDL